MTIAHPKDLFQRLQEHYNENAEELWVANLKVDLSLVELEMVHRGSAAFCLACPRDVFRSAVRNNSSYVVLAHNHTTGDCTPSEQDLRITKKLFSIGRLLEIPVIDHLVFTKNEFCSMDDMGIISKFAKSYRARF